MLESLFEFMLINRDSGRNHDSITNNTTKSLRFLALLLQNHLYSSLFSIAEIIFFSFCEKEQIQHLLFYKRKEQMLYLLFTLKQYILWIKNVF